MKRQGYSVSVLPGKPNGLQQRKSTPLYYLKTKTGRVEMVLWFVAEGVDSAVMVRQNRAN
jgi:hypothetical protein